MPTRRTIETDIFNLPIRKKGINGKQKGNTNERECAKTVGFWTGVKFTRVPQSGGLRWKESNRIAGDIVCELEQFDFQFTVETKHLKDIHIGRYLPKRSRIYRIWKQALSDSQRCDKLPMAMLRNNGLKRFKVGDESYQDYYLILDKRFGGSLASLFAPVVLEGHCENTDAILIGFKFSDLISGGLDYHQFAHSVKHGNFIAKFKSHYGQSNTR